MNEENNIQKEATSQSEETAKFTGYTISQIKHRRALVAVKRDYVFEQLINEKTRISKLDFMPAKASGTMNFITRSAPIIGKIAKGLSYMDYISIGMSTVSTLRKIIGWYRGIRKKK